MMDDLDPVDLTSLDPAREPARWAARMESTRLAVTAVLLERGRRLDPLEIVSGWARPILAAAAALLIVLGSANRLLGRPAEAPVSEARRLAQLSEAAVAHGRTLTGAELRATIDRRGRP